MDDKTQTQDSARTGLPEGSGQGQADQGVAVATATIAVGSLTRPITQDEFDALTFPLPIHPAAELFHVMPAERLAALGQHMIEHGLQNPIVLHRRSVIDGRCRVTAGDSKGFVFEARHFVEYIGDSPAEFVVGQNLHRRHEAYKTKSQLAALAAELAAMFKEEAAQRMRRGAKAAPGEAGSSAKKAAEQISNLTGEHVSERYTEMATEIKKEDPAAFQDVKNSKISLSQAHKKIVNQKNQLNRSLPPDGLTPEEREAMARRETQRWYNNRLNAFARDHRVQMLSTATWDWDQTTFATFSVREEQAPDAENPLWLLTIDKFERDTKTGKVRADGSLAVWVTSEHLATLATNLREIESKLDGRSLVEVLAEFRVVEGGVMGFGGQP